LERQTSVQWVLIRHENAAALATSAYAKITGRLGVCAATSEPGVLHFVCGVMDAHLDRVPLLALTGLISTAQQGHREFQDVDQTSLFRSMLGRSATVVDSAQAPALLRNSVGHALPYHEAVHVALPSNILTAELNGAHHLSCIEPQLLPMPLHLMPPPPAALDIVAAELEHYEHIAIVVGRHAIHCGAAIEVLAPKLGAPIMTSLDGKGTVDEGHDLALGVLGTFGFPAVETTKQMLRLADSRAPDDTAQRDTVAHPDVAGVNYCDR
jgi:thiamine pyrophosphate-dependent acetolactate synthase large subunit-like protein